MTEEQMHTILKRDYKHKYERCTLIDRVNKTTRYTIFVDSYTSKEINPIFEEIVKNKTSKVKEVLESCYCYKNI